MCKVSIIMPVYNSEQYLRKAVESVLNQEFDSFELILVDDGSPDGSGAICDSYAEKYDNVKVIHKSNGGICSARNAGIAQAQGEYIGFCDNDDQYLPGLIHDIFKQASDNQVDLMRYAKIKRLENDKGKVWQTVCKIEEMAIDRIDFYKHYLNIRKEDTVWTGFYKRSILEEHNIRFDESFKFGMEDMNFNLQYLKHCQRLGFCSKAYYFWTQRETHSTSRTFHREYLDNVLVNIQLEYEFMTQVCEGKINNYKKNVFLVNCFVYPIVEYMCIKKCNLTMKEKVAQLEKFRNHPIFDEQIPKETLKKTKKNNYRVYLTMKLFDRRKFRSLITILDIGTSVLAKFRFK